MSPESHLSGISAGITFARMQIAFNIRKWNDQNGFLRSLHLPLLVREIQHQQSSIDPFFISDKRLQTDKFENNRLFILGPVASNKLMERYWFELKLPKLLEKQHAALLFSFADRCSMSTKLPQTILLPTVDFLITGKFTKYLTKTNTVVTLTEYSKKILQDQFGLPPEKIFVMLPPATNEYKQLETTESEKLKLNLTDGKEYFFCPVHDHYMDLINLLKAFSIFKKRQKSEMKLLIHGALPAEFQNKLSSYKYRQDIILTNNDLPILTAAAYAVIHMRADIVSIPPVLKTGTPLIVPPGDELKEIAGDAALFANTNDTTDLADKMMLIYKDEILRSALKINAIRLSPRFEMSAAATSMLTAIHSAIRID